MIHDTQSVQISQKQNGCNICNNENNVPSRLSPQWLYGNSYTWVHEVWFKSKKYIYENVLRVAVLL